MRGIYHRNKDLNISFKKSVLFQKSKVNYTCEKVVNWPLIRKTAENIDDQVSINFWCDPLCPSSRLFIILGPCSKKRSIFFLFLTC